MPISALLPFLVAAAAQGSSTSAVVSSQPDDSPEALAAATFALQCVQTLKPEGSPAEYARASDQAGAELARNYPAQSASFRFDGNDGRGCRSRYTGDAASSDRLWGRLVHLTDGLKTPPCSVAERDETRVRTLCADTAAQPPRRLEFLLQRSGAGAAQTVTASVAYVPPAAR